MAWQDVVFQYDGTFDGFLCCVFDSYVHKEFPIAFSGDEECWSLIAQAPKVAPYREVMRQNMADALGVNVTQISIKATTEEHLGFTGSGEGLAAHAVALVEKL